MTEDKKKVHSRLIIVSNRLPLIVSQKDNNQWTVEPGSGGLVTAMAPVLKNRGGVWIGWPGTTQGYNKAEISKLIKNTTKDAGYQLKPVYLSGYEVEMYYKGFSNEVLWPLFHDFQSYCNFNPEYWNTYKNVNHQFAETVHANGNGEDFIWIHEQPRIRPRN